MPQSFICEWQHEPETNNTTAQIAGNLLIACNDRSKTHKENVSHRHSAELILHKKENEVTWYQS